MKRMILTILAVLTLAAPRAYAAAPRPTVFGVVQIAQDQGPSPISPGIGACVPLPDPPLVADWTAKFLEVVLLGDWHRQPCGA
jgi:hypothetical protein